MSTPISMPKGYKALGAFPIDASTLFSSFSALQTHAEGTTSFAGQVCSVFENNVVTVYKINSDKSLTAIDTTYTHPTGDGNLHVPATGTTNNGKVLKAGSTAGSAAWGSLTDIGAQPAWTDAGEITYAPSVYTDYFQLPSSLLGSKWASINVTGTGSINLTLPEIQFNVQDPTSALTSAEIEKLQSRFGISFYVNAQNGTQYNRKAITVRQYNINGTGPILLSLPQVTLGNSLNLKLETHFVFKVTKDRKWDVNEQPQSDWNQTNSFQPDFIKNKPTIPYALTEPDSVTLVTQAPNNSMFVSASSSATFTIATSGVALTGQRFFANLGTGAVNLRHTGTGQVEVVLNVGEFAVISYSGGSSLSSTKTAINHSSVRWTGSSSIPNATTSSSGLMSSTDKTKLNSAATLDANNKLLTSQLPDLAITDFLGACADQTEMLAKTGQKGDWVTRADDGKVYVITGDTPSSAGSWTALSYPASPVTSVNSKTGAVVLTPADIGALGLSTDSYIIARPGDDLVAKYDEAKLLTPRSQLKSATNRATLFIYPGHYVPASQIILDTEFVDVIGLESAFQRPSAHIVSEYGIELRARDIRVVGVSAPFQLGPYVGYDWNGIETIIENCVGGGNSFSTAQAGGTHHTLVGCVGGAGSFSIQGGGVTQFIRCKLTSNQFPRFYANGRMTWYDCEHTEGNLPTLVNGTIYGGG